MNINPNLKNAKLHAVLIGIDYYFPNTLPDGGTYPSLGGCVRDISHVEDFLIRNIGISNENIMKLTSSNYSVTDRPSESPDKWPTYKNIVDVFNKVIKCARPGDQVYVHYSGHGGRVKTLIPKIKGEEGLDETLVPTDIGNTGTRYLRDIEIAQILRNMLEKKLIVTIVLDSCHSGGATRGRGGAAIRGTDIVDTMNRPHDSLVAAVDELSYTWQNFLSVQSTATEATRSFRQTSGWLPEPKGYVLIAACRPSESAYEYAFEGGERNGALTYWLLKSLAYINKGLTYKTIYERLVAKIHSQFPLQTPMLEGDGNREVFGSDHIRSVYAVNVMKVDEENERVLLNVGQAHGVRKGVQFAIYPSGVLEFDLVGKRLAVVEIEEKGSANSWAKITAKFNKGIAIEPGGQAVLIDLTNIHLRRTVRIVVVNQNNMTSPATDNKHEEALDKVKNIIESEEGKGFLELATENTDKADYQIAVNEKGQYEIWDPAGMVIPNLSPHLRIAEHNSASSLIKRLVHLTKYSNVQQLDNLDTASPLSQKLIVELFGVSQDYEPGDRLDLQPISPQINIQGVRVGQKLMLRIRNALLKESKQVLNIAVLDLQPDWGITQIFPSSPGSYFSPIDPDQEEFVYLQAGLPSGYKEGRDIIKVFATIDQTNFRWLELDALDQPTEQREATRGNMPTNPLERLMAAITKDKAGTRDLNPSAAASKEWTTAQLEVKVFR
jgi:Caspase domain